MEVRRKKLDKRIMNQKGSTMVETLASFVVLFIVLAALYGIVTFSTELYMRSVDMSRLQQRFFQEIYKKNIDTTFIDRATFVKGYGGQVDLNGETCEHAALNFVIKTDGYSMPDAMKNSEISMDKISVTSYVCKEDNDGNGISPKAVIFEYEE